MQSVIAENSSISCIKRKETQMNVCLKCFCVRSCTKPDVVDITIIHAQLQH